MKLVFVVGGEEHRPTTSQHSENKFAKHVAL